ncbi:MAG: apolipoprotein N-acyltransferase [Gemmataceae bacterium]|nr:apolipoprotein N-acyltransferase [Gemmataceae bacterium]
MSSEKTTGHAIHPPPCLESTAGYLWLAGLGSAVLTWAAFFPIDAGPLGFVALVPWLGLAVTAARRRTRYAVAYLTGMLLSALTTQWVRVAHPMMYLAWLAFTLVLPLFGLVVLAGVRALLVRGVPLTVALPLTLVTLDYVRAHFPFGFPFLEPLGLYQRIGFGWYFLGYSQHAFVPFIQSADLGGVYLVTALTAAVNGLLADWLWSRGIRRWPLDPAVPLPWPHRRLVGLTLAVGLVMLTNLAYGLYRLQHPPFEEGPLVTALQGVIPQDVKNERDESLIRAYRDLHQQALQQQPPPDLIVWPETCCPVDYCEIAPGETPPNSFAEYTRLCRRAFERFQPGVPTLLGLNALIWQQGRQYKYNSALLVQPGPERFGPRYDKMHLVPFGEYVPFGETLPFLRRLTPYDYDYVCVPGTNWTRFRFADRYGQVWSFGCLICYEDTDPDLARRYVATEPVDFLVNISNDGWFDGTEEHEQHLAICRFRALETRRSIVRAVNMGISAVIDPDGQLVALPACQWSRSKKVEALVTASVPIDGRRALYPYLGDWVPALTSLSWLLLAVALPARR